ncbi:MAG: amidohydrolase family protein [Acidimicrobiia bacterium]|nr:amidohydrolase family protein [Acidimicrobiia bacterium]
MTADLVVKGGTVVTSEGRRRADLSVSAGRVAAVGDLDSSDNEVDASGLLVLPGMVDTHVHLMDPGPTDREDFPTGTAAAAGGGITTIIEHTHSNPVRSRQDLVEKKSYLRGHSHVDYGLAAHIWPEDVSHLADTWDAGVAFFKMFTCTTHGVPGLDPAMVKKALDTLAGCGAKVLAHCEDESLTGEAEKILRQQGRTDPGVIPEWRTREAELVAVASTAILTGASGASVTLAHVSHPDAVDLVAGARARGADIAAEACPQYLALDEEEVLEHGALRKFTPPARIRDDEDRSAMWNVVARGDYSHFSTDHAPSTLAQKNEGDIWSVPFGLPGVDTTLPFLIDAALTGHVSLEHVVKMTSMNPASRYGLAPRKGSLVVGSDADFVLVDPDAQWQVSDADIVSKAGWSPYSGRTLRGRIVATYLRGRQITENRRVVNDRIGEFLPGVGSHA